MHVEEGDQTSICAILILDKERTMCCSLAAASKYPTSHFEANMDVLADAKILYTTSHFIFANNEVVMKVGQYASENDIPMAFNLSAEYTIQFALDKVTAALEHADYIFSNEHEAAEFGKSQGLQGEMDLKEVAKKLATWKKVNTKRPRVAVIT